MKRRTNIFVIWIATCMMLLSTIVEHHHHEDRICFVEETCAEDGRVNDEHTHHREDSAQDYGLHQLHQFIADAKTVHSTGQHILDYGLPLMAVLPSAFSLKPACSTVVSLWQQTTCPLSTKTFSPHSRRGPPTLSLI